uniref:Uncharacterized protein n=1 Tax=Amphimedon queenslandica TaxID=400682 RepID=A0A1X7VC67_AMPQE
KALHLSPWQEDEGTYPSVYVINTDGQMSHSPLKGDTVMTCGSELYGMLQETPPSQ